MKNYRSNNSRLIFSSFQFPVSSFITVLLVSAFQIQAKPNILFIMTDDLGWTDPGYMGSKFYETPILDQMAEEGMVFNSAYSNAANCAPSRVALISGQYAPRTGTYTVGNPARGESRNRKLIPASNNPNLASSKITMAEALKDGGYTTLHVGKWHAGNVGPTEQGFDQAHSSYGTSGDERWRSANREADQVLAWLDDVGAGPDPFFIYLCFNFPHLPLGTTQELEDKYAAKAELLGVADAPNGTEQNNPVYAGMVESIDENVGRILDKLEELGVQDSTIVFFFSDNGGTLEQWSTVNKPLRSSKGTLYEGGIRVPMIVYWPGQVTAGTRSDVPVVGTDFYPTFLELAGLDLPDGHPLDGVSLVPLITETGGLDRESMFFHYPVYLQSYNTEIQGMWRNTPSSAIRKGDFKFIEYFEFGQIELYNVVEDLSETTNLVQTMPGKAHELRDELMAWRAEMNAPVPTELNPDYDPDSIITGYVTYEDIESQLVFGCTDPGYEEYDPDANANDPDMCLTGTDHGVKILSAEAVVRKWPAIITIKTGKKHSVTVLDVSGKTILAESAARPREYNLQKQLITGMYVVNIRIGGRTLSEKVFVIK